MKTKGFVLSFFACTTLLSTANADMNVGGLVQFDGGFHFTKDKKNIRALYKSGVGVNKIKASVYGSVEDWDYNLVLRNSLSHEVTAMYIENAYAQYNAKSYDMSVAFGIMYPVFGYENSLTEANYNFLEGSILNQTYGHVYAGSPSDSETVIHRPNTESRTITVKGNTDKIMAGVSLFFPLKQVRVLGTEASSEMIWGLSARGVFSPMHSGTKAYHVGGSAFYSNLNAKTTVTESEYFSSQNFQMGPSNFGTRGFAAKGVKFPEENIASFNVDTVTYLGLEAAAVNNSFSAFGEVIYSIIKNKSTVGGLKTEDKWLGFNAEAAYVITGESRSYDAGTIGNVVAMNNAYGAFEVAGRFTYLDMTGENVKENTATFISTDHVKANIDKSSSWLSMWNVSASGTWYLNKFASLKANLTLQRLPEAVSQSHYSEKDKNLVGFGLRGQLAW